MTIRLEHFHHDDGSVSVALEVSTDEDLSVDQINAWGANTYALVDKVRVRALHGAGLSVGLAPDPEFLERLRKRLEEKAPAGNTSDGKSWRPRLWGV